MPEMLELIELKKKLAGEKAVEYIEDGMTIGLGSGSTVYWTIKKLAELVQQGMHVKGIPSSLRTQRWANEFGIPLTDFAHTLHLDLAIDGADEVDQHYNLIKGGGGSLLREKLVDASSSILIIVVDDSKLVVNLGKFPLPIEVVPFGWEVTAQTISNVGCDPTLRRNDKEIFTTNNGNYILDCQFDAIPNPEQLHNQLKLMLGVVETGLFVGMTDKVIVGEEHGVRILEKRKL